MSLSLHFVQDEIGLREWLGSLKSTHKDSLEMLSSIAKKATKIYGTENRTLSISTVNSCVTVSSAGTPQSLLTIMSGLNISNSNGNAVGVPNHVVPPAPTHNNNYNITNNNNNNVNATMNNHVIPNVNNNVPPPSGASCHASSHSQTSSSSNTQQQQQQNNNLASTVSPSSQSSASTALQSQAVLPPLSTTSGASNSRSTN